MKDLLLLKEHEIELVQEDKLVEEEILNRNINLELLIYLRNKETTKSHKSINEQNTHHRDQLNDFKFKRYLEIKFFWRSI